MNLEMEYYFIGTVVFSEESIHFSPDFLNLRTLCGMASHKILLKINVPIILLYYSENSIHLGYAIGLS